MLSQIITTISAEIKSYSRAEKLFILFAMLTGFCMTGEYAMTKPTGTSVFIAAYGSSFYPYAWLATLPFNLCMVWLYNKFVSRIGCFRMLCLTAGAGFGITLFCAFNLAQIKWLPFVFYLWKDVYILIMLQQLWSVIHSTISKERARYLYGIIFGVGGLGSIMGSLVPTLFAVQMGSSKILLFNLPMYLLVMLFYAGVMRLSKSLPSQKLPEKGDKSGGVKLIRQSKYLQFILLIVILMQIASNLLDYRFNHMVQTSYPNCDVRTQFYGQFWGVIHTVNLCLQFVGSFLCVKLIGLKKSHVYLPLLLLINSMAFLAMPTLAVMCMAYGTVKAFDYSLFAILKEMLYVPLRPEEKFKAKAVIDVFAYRSAKALASCAVLGLQLFAISVVSWVAAGIFSCWVVASLYFLRRPEQSATVI
ncbi:MAG: hypothetical protein KDK50_06700 [Chlamydiia bacterium]|nr:hypothetical protein [Chlamydiia bacterium]MCP5491901.1 hypothetical protein [Chlamydiales bacterium]